MANADIEGKPPKDSRVDDEKVHMFLFIHGLWGNPNHMLTIEKAVKKSLSPISAERIVTIKPSSFRFWKTYDGIQRCAENTIADLLYEIETLKLKNNCRVTKISIVGYSLGGLIARYVIGCLYELGFFDEVTPVFFSTFATPHVGIHFFKDNIFDKLANSTGKYLFGKTGSQLFLADSENLLVSMSRLESRYIKGLKLFEKRIILANIKNDRTVPFYTSFITEFSPFDLINSVNIQYFEGTPPANVNNVTVWPKFVDLEKTQKINNMDMKHRNVQEATSVLRSNVIIRYTLLLFASLVLFPLYLPLILCLSLYVSGYSILKIKLVDGPDIVEHWAGVRTSVFHGGSINTARAEKGDSRRQERKKLSRHESFKGDTSKLTENVMENVLAVEEKLASKSEEVPEKELNMNTNTTSNPDTLPAGMFEANSSGWTSSLEDSSGETNDAGKKMLQSKVSLLPRIAKKKPVIQIPTIEYDEIIRKHANLLDWSESKRIPLFEDKVLLPFSEQHLTIVRNLNELEWIKVPIYHDLFNAHDSIVARRGDMRNPKGTCTLFFWGSILRIHMLEDEE